MSISELIKELQTILQEYGDLTVANVNIVGIHNEDGPNGFITIEG